MEEFCFRTEEPKLPLPFLPKLGTLRENQTPESLGEVNCPDLNERDGAIRIAEGLDHGLGRYQMRYTVCRRGRLCLLILKGIQQVLAPMLLVAVLHNSAEGLSPGDLLGSGGKEADGELRSRQGFPRLAPNLMQKPEQDQ